MELQGGASSERIPMQSVQGTTGSGERHYQNEAESWFSRFFSRSTLLLIVPLTPSSFFHLFGCSDGFKSLQEAGAEGGIAALRTDVLARLLHQLLHFPCVQLRIRREH
jgi:hypothetical protein